MTTDILWNSDNSDMPIRELDRTIGIPDWIDRDITPADVAAIIQGGCASGAYMPAVTYHSAVSTMARHGNDVMEFIESAYGELPAIPDGTSWSGMAVHFLSCAVELWSASVEDKLTESLQNL